MPEGVDKDIISDKLLQEESSGELVLGKNAIMCGFGNVFNLCNGKMCCSWI